ncbi:hypothetical protein QOT17_017998 [Balamuthia mandrillaris]
MHVQPSLLRGLGDDAMRHAQVLQFHPHEGEPEGRLVPTAALIDGQVDGRCLNGGEGSVGWRAIILVAVVVLEGGRSRPCSGFGGEIFKEGDQPDGFLQVVYAP